MSDKIQNVFGKFAVELADGPVMFNTEAEAQTALSEFENGAEQRQLAADFCAANGFAGKNAKGKSNVVVAFLQWVDAGQPGPVATEEETVEATEEAGEEVEF